MTTAAQIRDRVEERLGDTSNKTWSEDLLLELINESIRWFAGELSRIANAGYFKAPEETFTVAASTMSFDPTTLTGHATHPFREINQIYHRDSTGFERPVDRVADGDFNTFRTIDPVSPDQTPAMRLRRPDSSTWSIDFLPLASAQRTFRIEYVYLPADLAAGGTVPTPADYDDLLVMRVRQRALEIRNQANLALEARVQTRLQEVRTEIAQSMDMGQTRRRRAGFGEWVFP